MCIRDRYDSKQRIIDVSFNENADPTDKRVRTQRKTTNMLNLEQCKNYLLDLANDLQSKKAGNISKKILERYDIGTGLLTDDVLFRPKIKRSNSNPFDYIEEKKHILYEDEDAEKHGDSGGYGVLNDEVTGGKPDFNKVHRFSPLKISSIKEANAQVNNNNNENFKFNDEAPSPIRLGQKGFSKE
eukprot:TRINITY_DN3028_c0_g1_i3.p1 TRINITY_DN3028_c0_g1~~TRINITY_DN3028_c0_g1_i3.p1  ORF type:complete len:212 (-),score=63.91 TRINITY_DN3028_c0_g1_i3:209-763(-)